MGRAPVAGRRHVDFAGIGLGAGDEVGNRLGLNRWIQHHDVGPANDAPLAASAEQNERMRRIGVLTVRTGHKDSRHT